MKKLLVILFTLFSVSIFSQDLYIPDRPGYTYNAQTVGHKNIDVGMGFGYAYQHYNERTDLYYNTTAFRYGAFKFMEIKGEIDFGNLDSKSFNSKGIMGGMLGAKFPIHINDSIVQIGLVGTCYLPNFGEDAFQYPNASPQITLALQKNLGKISVFGNVGGVWNGINPMSDTYFVDFQEIASVSVYYFPSKLGLFIESWHKFSKGNPSYNNFDGGLVYIISDDLVCDFSVGLNYKEWNDDSFVNVGISWRILNNE